jgi:exonuclease III
LGSATKVDVNKTLVIFNKKYLILIVLIWSVLSINVINKCEGPSRPRGPRSGCEKVLDLRPKTWFWISNFCKVNQEKINVNKWLRRVKLWTYDAVIECLGREDEDYSTGNNWSQNIDTGDPFETKSEILRSYENTQTCRKGVAEGKQFISCRMVLRLIIGLLLLGQTIERNPGPQPNNNNKKIKIVTYNCNGLGDKNKLKRLLNKLGPIVMKGGFVFLQETHLVDLKYLNLIWKHECQSNCVSTNSAGVAILYSKDYKTIKTDLDAEGRQLVTTVGNDEDTFILANAYFPNDHKGSIDFTETLYTKILAYQSVYSEAITIMAGDINTCLEAEDSMNRQKSKVEGILAENIIKNNKIAKLVDAYRTVHSNNGFTWKRGVIYSQLD